MNTHKVFCIVGETGSGKDTIVNEIINKYGSALRKVVSYTTRKMRDNETDGVEHYFVTDDEYDSIRENNVIIAETKIGDYRYMATLDELNKSNIYIIDPIGIESLKSKSTILKTVGMELVVIYIYSSLEDRTDRAKIRSDFAEAFLNRVKSEQEQFDYFRENRKYDHIIINKTILHSIRQLELILNYEGI